MHAGSSKEQTWKESMNSNILASESMRGASCSIKATSCPFMRLWTESRILCQHLPPSRALTVCQVYIIQQYLNKIINFNFSRQQLQDLRDTVLRLTWIRQRIVPDIPTISQYITNDRVAQPISMAAMAVPKPNIQARAKKDASIGQIANLGSTAWNQSSMSKQTEQTHIFQAGCTRMETDSK